MSELLVLVSTDEATFPANVMLLDEPSWAGSLTVLRVDFVKRAS